MTNYIMPTSADLPPIHVHFEEIPFEHGAFGAKGIGELPMDGPAPAILNAIENALGIPFNHIPLMPEDLEQNNHPTEPEIRAALAGNLCRCTGYIRIFESILRACDRTEVQS
jgi:hypothetical protein